MLNTTGNGPKPNQLFHQRPKYAFSFATATPTGSINCPRGSETAVLGLSSEISMVY